MTREAMDLKRKWMLWTALAVAVALLGALVWQLEFWNWHKLDLNKLTELKQTTVVYAADGESAGSLYGSENRVYVPLTDVPQHVREAFIAAEDQRFYEHSGVDMVRLFGALWHDIQTLSFSQGASTITQQLIKLTHLSNEKTLSRKAQEALLALQLERKLTKDEILERYLNVVYFGKGAYGIEAASNAYFDKSASELTLAEGALLAGVIKSPTNYAPHLKPENALKRRDLVLNEMVQGGFISEQMAAEAKAEALALAPTEQTIAHGWYMDAAAAEAQALLGIGGEELLVGGYRIYTALDREAQLAAETLYEDGANFPDAAKDGTPAQAALVAMNTQNGEIVSLIGGRSYDVRLGLNRATQIRRQPGSAIKPVSTYAAAIERFGFLPSNFINDEQRAFAGGYTPGNAGGNYHGEVTLREALSRSLNVATVDLADTIGISSVRAQIARFGIPLSDDDANLALALGAMTDGVSPAELCAAYSARSTGGTRVAPHLIRRIESADGEVLYEAREEFQRAVTPETAYMLTDMLTTAATEGSAKALSAVNARVAAKTGTVGMDGGNRDAWTVAYTPRLAVAVWMGFDEPDREHAIPDWAGGSSFPAQLCAKFLSGAGRDWLNGDFQMPRSLKRVVVDALALEQDNAVALAAERTPAEYTKTEIFYANRMPEVVSDKWDAPLPVTDLALVSAAGEPPVLRFTSRDENAEYLLIRRTNGAAEIAAELRGKAGEVIEFIDAGANLNEVHEYSAIPRHALLYQEGSLVTGAESARVRYQPGGLLNRVAEFITGGATREAAPPETETNQSLFW